MMTSAIAHLSAQWSRRCANSSRTAAAAVVCRYFLAYSTRNISAADDRSRRPTLCHQGRMSIALDRDRESSVARVNASEFVITKTFSAINELRHCTGLINHHAATATLKTRDTTGIVSGRLEEVNSGWPLPSSRLRHTTPPYPMLTFKAVGM